MRKLNLSQLGEEVLAVIELHPEGIDFPSIYEYVKDSLVRSENPGKQIGAVLANLVRWKRIGKKEALYFLLSTPKPSAISEPALFGLYVARTVPVSPVNSRRSDLTLRKPPIRVQNCGSFTESANGLSVQIPIGGSISFCVLEEVPDRLITPRTRAINKRVTITLNPMQNKTLVVDGQRWEGGDSFSFDVPDGHWLIMTSDEMGNEVSVAGQELELSVCAVYVSTEETFDEDKSLLVPMLWNTEWTINGDDGVRIDYPFIGFVVLAQDLPAQYRAAYASLLSRNTAEEQQYAAVLCLNLKGNFVAWKAS